MRPIGNALMGALLQAKAKLDAVPVAPGDPRTWETDVSTDEPDQVPQGTSGVADEDTDIASYLTPAKSVPKSVPVEKVGHAELVLAVRELMYDVRMRKVDTGDVRLDEVLVGLDLIEQLLS